MEAIGCQICQVYNNTFSSCKIPEWIVLRYDSAAKPAYRNIYFNVLVNDEITMEGLRAGAKFGFAQGLPEQVLAFMEAHFSGSIADDSSAFGYYRRNSNPEYAKRRARIRELRELLCDSRIEEIANGWIGIRPVEHDPSGAPTKLRCARVTRQKKGSTDPPERRVGIDAASQDFILTEIAELPSDLWTPRQLEIISNSAEYQDSMLWLYNNGFIP